MERTELLKLRRTLISRIAKAERRLRKHNEHLAMRRADPEYSKGKWVDNLGTGVSTPCMVIADKTLRLQLRAAVLSVRDWPSGAIVCHRCDVNECIAPDHLFPGTHRDNARDCALKGRWSMDIVDAKAKLATDRAQLVAVEMVLSGVSDMIDRIPLQSIPDQSC